MNTTQKAENLKAKLRYHVTGAIERGEQTPIVEQTGARNVERVKKDTEIGCNVRGRLEWIIALTVHGKTKEAIEEAKRLAKFFPKRLTFSYTEKEKLAASIIDQLTPVWINETGAYIAPSTFKALTKRLTELL